MFFVLIILLQMQNYSTLVGINKDITLRCRSYCFCIHDQLTHKYSTLLPQPNEPPIFAQLYINDHDEAIKA